MGVKFNKYKKAKQAKNLKQYKAKQCGGQDHQRKQVQTLPSAALHRTLHSKQNGLEIGRAHV
jgi:hypothetical protein